MSQGSISPRLPALDEDEIIRRIDEHLPEHAGRIDVHQAFVGLIAHHPALYSAFIDFGNKIRFGTIPDRDREIVILRTACNCRCAYQWGQHVPIAQAAGLTEPAILSIAGDGTSDALTMDDRVLIAAADQLHTTASIDDPTWESLALRYDAQHLIEFAMLVGTYQMLAYLMNAARLRPEPGAPPLPLAAAR